jgi:hypothetical protein
MANSIVRKCRKVMFSINEKLLQQGLDFSYINQLPKQLWRDGRCLRVSRIYHHDK